MSLTKDYARKAMASGWSSSDFEADGQIFWDTDLWGAYPGEPTAYDRGDAVRGGAGVGAALGFAAGVATGVPNGGGVGSISGGFLGGAAGGGLYDVITSGDGSAVLGDNYNPMGDYVGNYGGGG